MPRSDTAPIHTEEWRPVPGFPDYEISDQGRVLSHKRGAPRVLRLVPDRYGHLQIDLATGVPKQKVRRQVHALMLEAFVGPRPEGAVTRHLNGVAWDNRLENLTWGTQSENHLDAVRHGTHHLAKKTHCPSGHPYDDENTRVIPSRPTARYCRACHKGRQAVAA